MPPVNRYRTRLLVATAALLLVSAVPVSAQDASPSPSPSEPPMEESTPEVTVTPPPGAEELASMIPTQLMGEAVPTPMLYSGLDWMGDQATVFEQIVADQGKSTEDFSMTATVTAASGGVEFSGLRIAGADATEFVEALLPLVEQGNLGSVDRETVELAEKPVLVLTDSDDGSVFAYVYASGDVVWVAFGSEETVTALIEALP